MSSKSTPDSSSEKKELRPYLADDSFDQDSVDPYKQASDSELEDEQERILEEELRKL